jgi:hypothetical protein
MSVLRHTWQGRRIIRQFVIVMLVLAGQITLASCRHPGARGRALARQGVASLRVGMTRAQVIGALGQRLFAGPVDGKGVLTYAYAGEWYVGSRTLWSGCVVTLSDGVLDSVYLSNSSVCIQTFI